MDIDSFVNKNIDIIKSRQLDRDEFMFQCIKDRLDLNYSNYEKDLTTSLNYLLRKNELSIVNKLRRL